MIRKILFILGGILIAVQATPQTVDKKEILTKEKKQTTLNPGTIHKPVRLPVKEKKLQIPESREPDITLDTTGISGLLIGVTPLIYGNNAVFPFSKKMFVYLEGGQKQYLNFANYNLAYMALGWRFNSRLNLTGGLLAVKQFTSRVPYGMDRSGAKFNLNYSITSQLEFNMWGQYLTGSPFGSPADLLLPQTGTGVSMLLNLGNGSQIGIGAEYQYNSRIEKWDYQSGGKLKVKF